MSKSTSKRVNEWVSGRVRECVKQWNVECRLEADTSLIQISGFFFTRPLPYQASSLKSDNAWDNPRSVWTPAKKETRLFNERHLNPTTITYLVCIFTQTKTYEVQIRYTLIKARTQVENLSASNCPSFAWSRNPGAESGASGGAVTQLPVTGSR